MALRNHRAPLHIPFSVADAKSFELACQNDMVRSHTLVEKKPDLVRPALIPHSVYCDLHTQ
jgi:hypothetical protein